MSLALVTGATGLVGSHIVDRLLRDGWSVRALARSPESARATLPHEVDVIRGDVLDESSMIRAASRCHAIFHTAANITGRGGWEAYRVTNVEGTRNVLVAAERTRARLLQLSSVAVYGPSARYAAAKRGELTDERTVLGPLNERAYYARSKRESEALVLDAHRQGRVWATAVRPDVIYGRRDRQFVPRMARLVQRAFIPMLHGGRTTMAIVHAANVADGAVRAATTDVAGGKAYNLANDYDVSVRRFFELAGEGLRRRPLLIPMPMWAAESILATARWIGRLLTGSSLINRSTLDFISRDNPFTSQLARDELGWSPDVRPEVGIPDAFRWWKETIQRTQNEKGRDRGRAPH